MTNKQFEMEEAYLPRPQKIEQQHLMIELSWIGTMFCAQPYAQRNGYYSTLHPQIDQSPPLDMMEPSTSALLLEQVLRYNSGALGAMH